MALLDEGCTCFFVATLDEAEALRRYAVSAAIYVLSDYREATARAFAELEAIPVLNSLAHIESWSAFCRNERQRLPAALHLDTGMNRLGLRPEDVRILQQRSEVLTSFDLKLVMSHLACADTPGHGANAVQRRLFDELTAALPATPRSLANSAATLLGPQFHYELIRPGIALYGGEALSGIANPMKPVVRLLARIVQVRRVPAGEAVGYGHTVVVGSERRLATVAVGYADGIPRRPTDLPGPSPYAALIDGYRAPPVGRVSMDTTILDVTEIPESVLAAAEFAEFCGLANSVDDLAAHGGTIGYDVLTRLGPRFHRLYTGLGEQAS
jgi:alanine racemase